jgi:hypothetical protein
MGLMENIVKAVENGIDLVSLPNNEDVSYYKGEKMDGYIEAFVLVGGALDENVVFYMENQWDVWFARIKTEDFGNEQAEVYRIYHAHNPALSNCQCAQYLQSHLPEWKNY